MTIKKFWKNKKILITGIDGFVGSNLAKQLIQNGANVSGIIQKKKSSLLYFEGFHRKCRLYKGDIKNNKFIEKIVKKNKFQILFHLAAQVEVGVANKDPFRTWESNIRGTYVLLNNFVNNKYIKSIIVASSDKSYGEYPKKLLPYKETYLSRAIYPYDVSKACADMISRSYASELFKLPIIITRFANIYGPGQLNFSALIPDLINSIIKNKKFKPRGNGKDLRDYVYIDDIVEVYLLLSLRLYKNSKFSGEIFNAGSNKPMQVREVVKKIYFYANKKKEYLEILSTMKNKKTKGELNLQSMDFTKLNKYFGWKPKHKFENTIAKVFNWYQKYLNSI